MAASPGTVLPMTNRTLWIREIARAALRANVTADDLARAFSPEERVAVQAEFDRRNHEQRPTGYPQPVAEQRSSWRQRAVWLAQLGLSPVEETPVEIVEEVANAALILLDENERLREDLTAQSESFLFLSLPNVLDRPDHQVDAGTSNTGPVAHERNGRLCVITGVPHTWRADGSRHFAPDVAKRLDVTLRRMHGSGNSVSIRAWADLANPPAPHRSLSPIVDVAHPDRLRFIPSDLLDRGVPDAAVAHDTAAHAAGDAFADYLDTPTPRQAVLTEQSITSLRYEWEVLSAVVRRLLDLQRDDRRIGRWLYDNLDNGTRITLGDVSEWPWLLDEEDA